MSAFKVEQVMFLRLNRDFILEERKFKSVQTFQEERRTTYLEDVKKGAECCHGRRGIVVEI